MILRPRGPYSLRQSLLGRAGGTLRLRGGELELTVRPQGGAGRARVLQLADGALRAEVLEGDPAAVAAEVRRRLSLDVDTTPFRERFADDPLLGPLVRRRPGLRPMVRGTVAQAALAAVAGQLVTWAEAAAIEARVVAAVAPKVGARERRPAAAPHPRRARPPSPPPSSRRGGCRAGGRRRSRACCGRSTSRPCAGTARRRCWRGSPASAAWGRGRRAWWGCWAWGASTSGWSATSA